MSDNFLNRVAIVTGAGSGIGEATAKMLYQKGANVVLIGRSNKVEKVKNNINDERNGLLSIQCDLTIESEVESMVEKTIEKFNKVDVLVNSAGVTGPGNIDNTSLEDWDYIHQNNGTSTFLCCKHVIPHMKKKKYGKILNISSIAGRFRGMTSGLHYAYTKSGLLGFTRQLGAEVAPWQINVNCLCPSQTKTQMLMDLINPDIEKKLNEIIPLKRIATPNEQARVICFLVSDEASYIAGAIIDSNGAQF